ncbi:hypothetical protein V1525DRAFT_56801 [Lipomyces kononenkoae]|uniref:Uncharacterized protein n=1 Tax=Lipomyces kononenkoae TaxID=34357 RepID=A0ACC3T6Q7_LIPKO
MERTRTASSNRVWRRGWRAALQPHGKIQGEAAKPNEASAAHRRRSYMAAHARGARPFCFWPYASPMPVIWPRAGWLPVCKWLYKHSHTPAASSRFIPCFARTFLHPIVLAFSTSSAQMATATTEAPAPVEPVPAPAAEEPVTATEAAPAAEAAPERAAKRRSFIPSGVGDRLKKFIQRAVPKREKPAKAAATAEEPTAEEAAATEPTEAAAPAKEPVSEPAAAAEPAPAAAETTEQPAAAPEAPKEEAK